MTDTSSLAITHATTDSYPVHAHRGSPAAVDGAASDSGAPDEEPYTIKCICSFDEDDGNTVFCEGCETWQHILCYYPDKKVPDVHNCVDCEPRPLDNRRAHERQRLRRIREKSEDGDRKPRRSGPKTNKRKSNDADGNAFGHRRHDSGSREQPPVKKARVSRRPSTSMSGISAPPGLSAESRNRRSSTSVAMSPTSIPGPSIPYYSDEFLSLYDRDDQFVESKSILNYGVDFVNEIVAWLKDPQILARVADGLSVEDFAKRSEEAMDRSRWPSLETETITDPTIEINVHKILKTRDPIEKDDIVGEIFGKLGHVKDYKKLDSNRWEELGHAMPFVFFNRQLDLYIDSRQEGNELRYVRRACEANVNLKIYITNGRQYHFCFVAKKPIPANSEITTMWYFDDSFFSADATVKEEFKDRVVDPKDAAICISTTLANFGGCACGTPQACVLNKLDRRAKPGGLANKHAKPKPKGKGKGKKPKTLGLPTDIGRAGSETTKNPDENDPAADARSTSGSARGRHTGSRDLSPTASQQLTLPELSSRERRKIADAEKQFQQLEQLKPVNPKRKKRSSGPATHSTPATVSSSTQTGYDFKPYHEPGPSRSSEMTGSSSRRDVAYVDAQIELYAGDIELDFLLEARRKRGYRLSCISRMTMMKAQWCAGLHVALDESQRDAFEAGDSTVVPPGVLPFWLGYYPHPLDDRSHIELLSQDCELMGIAPGNGPVALPLRWSFHQSKYPQPPVKYNGIEIRGIHYDRPARRAQGEIEESSASVSTSGPAVPPYWPSTAAHTFRMPGPGNRGNLHGSMPPPRASNLQSALSPGSMSTGSLASPSSHDTASPISLVPSSGSALAATPAKKKLSLGDYLIRRGTMTTTPTSEPTPAPAPSPAPPPAPGPLRNEARIRTQHFIAITTVFGDNHQPPPSRTEAGGDKNEPSDSHDISMEDAPETTPTKNPSISS
ncbi:unnamed protein product [Penicillium discolor]